MDNRGCFKMKLAIIIDSLRGGGAEGNCVILANKFVSLGWNIDVVVLSLKDSVWQTSLDTKVRLINLNVGHTRKSFFKLWNYIRVKKPQSVLVFDHRLAVMLVIVRIFSTYRFKIFARNIGILSQKRKHQKSIYHKYLIDMLVRFFYSKVDKIIAQCKGMADDLKIYYAMPADRIKIINNPINPEISEYLKDNMLSCARKNYILCVGRLEPVKAFHYAIEMMPCLIKIYPEVRLKILGTGSLESELKKLAQKLGVFERVDFEGFREKPFKYYVDARMTLLTSLHEGFPNTILDSIALGTPVVAFDCDYGPREIIQNTVNGYLVKYEDAGDLLYKIRLTLDRKWERGSIIDTAIRFSLQNVVSAYEELISNVS